MAEIPLNMAHGDNGSFRIGYSEVFQRALQRVKTKDHSLYERLEKQILKIMGNPLCGKPLRNVLKNTRRIHIDPYVLLYMVSEGEIRFLDFDHHNKIYRKYGG